MDVRTGTVRTDRFSMDYFTFGQGERTLVILPGLSVQSVIPSAETVAGAYRLLTDDFTVYLFDRRNELPDRYTIRDMADDTAEAMRTLGIRCADVFGTSQGGMIAMQIAVRHPSLVNSLALGSTSACPPDTLTGSWTAIARAGKRKELYLGFCEAIYPKEVYEGLAEYCTQLAETVTDEELSRFVIMAESIDGFDMRDELEKISCPVLVIGSRDDNVLGGEASEQIAAGLKCPHELYMYDGCGHAVYDLAPDYKERLLRFFTNV